jgi:hypothetical protein
MCLGRVSVFTLAAAQERDDVISIIFQVETCARLGSQRCARSKGGGGWGLTREEHVTGCELCGEEAAAFRSCADCADVELVLGLRGVVSGQRGS